MTYEALPKGIKKNQREFGSNWSQYRDTMAKNKGKELSHISLAFFQEDSHVHPTAKNGQ